MTFVLIGLVSGQFVVWDSQFILQCCKRGEKFTGVSSECSKMRCFRGSTSWESHLHSQVDLMGKPFWGLQLSCSAETAGISLASCCFFPLFSSYITKTASPWAEYWKGSTKSWGMTTPTAPPPPAPPSPPQHPQAGTLMRRIPMESPSPALP